VNFVPNWRTCQEDIEPVSRAELPGRALPRHLRPRHRTVQPHHVAELRGSPALPALRRAHPAQRHISPTPTAPAASKRKPPSRSTSPNPSRSWSAPSSPTTTADPWHQPRPEEGDPAWHYPASPPPTPCTAAPAPTAKPPTPRPHPGLTPAGLLPGYDCSQKRDGNYRHPTDCTKYVQRIGQIYAYEIDCGDCHPDAVTCPTGRLRYDQAKDKCLFADNTACVTG